MNAAEMALHWLGAYGIIFGPIALTSVGVLGTHAGASAFYRAISVVLGFAGIVSGLALVSIPAVQTVVGGGAVERLARYGLFLWQLIAGTSLLVTARRPSGGFASTAKTLGILAVGMQTRIQCPHGC